MSEAAIVAVGTPGTEPPAAVRQNAGVDLLVAADDRTGAFETAAALADRTGRPVPVVVWPETATNADTTVVDIQSRHLSHAAAAARAAALPSDGVIAHKIDSTLRGNWADELVARRAATGRPVLVVPALPALGRTCVGGVVLDHGRPVHEGGAGSDPRRPVRTSRPADLLHAAGATDLVHLATGSAVTAWLAAPHGVAVADAADDADIDRIVAGWVSTPDVLLAGTSAVIAHTVPVAGDPPGGEPLPAVTGPVLVVCGSMHPMARAQIAELEHRGVPVSSLVDDVAVRALQAAGRLVLATEIPAGEVDTPLAIAAATGLARGVRDLRDRVGLGALVLIGGDTAAAVLDGAEVRVHGSVAPGTAWATVAGFAMPILTRAGGFGSDHSLVELLWTTL